MSKFSALQVGDSSYEICDSEAIHVVSELPTVSPANNNSYYFYTGDSDRPVGVYHYSRDSWKLILGKIVTIETSDTILNVPIEGT